MVANAFIGLFSIQFETWNVSEFKALLAGADWARKTALNKAINYQQPWQ
jgi:hypothetical protein